MALKKSEQVIYAFNPMSWNCARVYKQFSVFTWRYVEKKHPVDHQKVWVGYYNTLNFQQQTRRGAANLYIIGESHMLLIDFTTQLKHIFNLRDSDNLWTLDNGQK